MKKQKGLSLIVTISGLGVVVAILVIVFVLMQKNQETGKTETQPVTQVSSPSSTPTPSVPAIQNTGDLNAATADLDKTDLNGIDKQLNQLDTDASTF